MQKTRETKADKTARLERQEKRYAEVQAIYDSGKCPYCGSGLRHNLSIAGWIQCEQFGADGFRKDDSKPSCSWQGFVKPRIL